MSIYVGGETGTQIRRCFESRGFEISQVKGGNGTSLGKSSERRAHQGME